MREFPYHPHLKDGESEAQEDKLLAQVSWNEAVRVGDVKTAGLCLNQVLPQRGKCLRHLLLLGPRVQTISPERGLSNSWTLDSFLVCLTLASIEINLHPHEWGARGAG